MHKQRVNESIVGKDKYILWGGTLDYARVLGAYIRRHNSVFLRLSDALSRQGSLKQVALFSPDIVLIDLPSNKDALEVARMLHACHHSWRFGVVLLGSEKSTHKEIIAALHEPIDDFIKKPIPIPLLAARCKALVRRVHYCAEPRDRMKYGAISLDMSTHQVHVAGRPIELTPREFALFFYLMQRPGQSIPRCTIMRQVWGVRYCGDMRTLNKHVETLRKKIGPKAARHIETISGYGYRFNRRLG